MHFILSSNEFENPVACWCIFMVTLRRKVLYFVFVLVLSLFCFVSYYYILLALQGSNSANSFHLKHRLIRTVILSFIKTLKMTSVKTIFVRDNSCMQ